MPPLHRAASTDTFCAAMLIDSLLNLIDSDCSSTLCALLIEKLSPRNKSGLAGSLVLILAPLSCSACVSSSAFVSIFWFQPVESEILCHHQGQH